MPPTRPIPVLNSNQPYLAQRRAPARPSPVQADLSAAEVLMQAQLATPGDMTLDLVFLADEPCPFQQDQANVHSVQQLRTDVDRWDTAETLGLTDPHHYATMDSARAAKASNHMAKIVHLIQGHISQNMFLTYIHIETAATAGTPLAQLNQQRLLSRSSRSWQRATGNFIIRGVLGVRAMLPEHALDLSSQEKRLAIWREIHDRAPLEIIKGMIATRYDAVNLEQIYNFPESTDNRRRIWKLLFAHLFEWSCESVFLLTKGITSWNDVTTPMRTEFYRSWRTFVTRQEFRALDLTGEWDVTKCPARSHRDLGRASDGTRAPY